MKTIFCPSDVPKLYNTKLYIDDNMTIKTLRNIQRILTYLGVLEGPDRASLNIKTINFIYDLSCSNNIDVTYAPGGDSWVLTNEPTKLSRIQDTQRTLDNYITDKYNSFTKLSIVDGALYKGSELIVSGITTHIEFEGGKIPMIKDQIC